MPSVAFHVLHSTAQEETKAGRRVDVLDREFRESFSGSVIVDESTGIPLGTLASVSQQLVGALKGATYTGKGSGALRIRCIGGRAN